MDEDRVVKLGATLIILLILVGFIYFAYCESKETKQYLASHHCEEIERQYFSATVGSSGRDGGLIVPVTKHATKYRCDNNEIKWVE